MTALDLAVIVESAAKAFYEGGAPSGTVSFEDAPALVKHDFREAILPAVSATLRALEQIAAECEGYAKANDQLADARIQWGETHLAQRAVGARDALNSVAKQLRALMPAATNTSTEVS